MADDIKQELGVWNQIQPAYRKPYNASWKSISYNMKEEIESDVKIGDVVRLLTASNHNFDTPEININIYFENSEIGNLLKINDIIKDSKGDIAFKVECKMGTTYLRRSAFEIIKCAPQPKEDLSYLIPLLKYNDII